MKSKSSLPYEIAGTLLGLVGAFVLVAVYFPVLNSGQARIELHGELPSLGYYILMTPIPVAMLIASWFCNRTAQRLKREAAAERPTSEPGKAEKSVEQVLKWVLLAIVLVVVVGAFFW